MTLFFVLSGFVIYYNYAETFVQGPFPAALYRFFAHRFARIYPLYIVSLAIAIILNPSILHVLDTQTVLAHLTLTQSWVNLEMGIFSPSWSISTEWFFYLAFVPLVFVIHRIRRPLVVLAIFSAVACVALIPVLNLQFVTTHFAALLYHGSAGPDPWGWFDYFNPYLRLLEFLAGCLAAKAYVSKSSLSPLVARAIFFASLIWCIVAVCFDTFTSIPILVNVAPNFLNAPAIAFVLFYCCRYATPLNGFLGSKALVLAGTVSYSVYVWCWVVVPQFRFSAPAVLNSSLLAQMAYEILGAVVATTIVAYISYKIIEEPSRRILRSAFESLASSRSNHSTVNTTSSGAN